MVGEGCADRMRERLEFGDVAPYLAYLAFSHSANGAICNADGEAL